MEGNPFTFQLHRSARIYMKDWVRSSLVTAVLWEPISSWNNSVKVALFQLWVFWFSFCMKQHLWLKHVNQWFFFLGCYYLGIIIMRYMQSIVSVNAWTSHHCILSYRKGLILPRRIFVNDHLPATKIVYIELLQKLLKGAWSVGRTYSKFSRLKLKHTGWEWALRTLTDWEHRCSL